MTPANRGRAVSAQKPPNPNRDCTELPSTRLDPSQPLYRAYNTAHTPGWYSSGDYGRFDLVSPNGTMYIADSVEVAMREKLGSVVVGNSLVLWSDVQNLAVAELTVVGRHCADFGAQNVGAWGITREIESMTPYNVPQKWASALFAAGHQGIRYGARHSPGNTNAWALFGSEGPARVTRLSAEDVDAEEACRRADIQVQRGVSSRAGLTVKTPPKR